jgi:hypothetical protein
MSLVNTILVDLSANDVTFTSVQGATTIENIVYNPGSGTVTFASLSANVISGPDFMTLLQQLTIFQNANIFNFSPGSTFIVPFNSFQTNEHYISFSNAWSLSVNEVSGPTISQYYADGSSGNIDISARSAPITIPFSEWIVYLAALKHYQSSVSTFFNIPI